MAETRDPEVNVHPGDADGVGGITYTLSKKPNMDLNGPRRGARNLNVEIGVPIESGVQPKIWFIVLGLRYIGWLVR